MVRNLKSNTIHHCLKTKQRLLWNKPKKVKKSTMKLLKHCRENSKDVLEDEKANHVHRMEELML